MKKNFNGKVLSKELWGRGLDSSDKILLQEIIDLNKQPGGCYAGDKHFADLLEESIVNVNRRIQKLKKSGRIFCTTTRDGKRCKRVIKFRSYVGSDKKSDQSNIEINNLIIQSSEVEINNLRNPDNVLDYQNVKEILQFDTSTQKPNSHASEENSASITGPESTGGFFHLVGEKSHEEIYGQKIEIPTEKTKMEHPTEEKKIEPSTEKDKAPEFLTNGIMLDGLVYYPLSMKIQCAMVSASELTRNKKVGKELLNILNKVTKQEQYQYINHKQKILNTKFLAEHKEKLQELDFQKFLDYLTSLNLPKHQKDELIPSARMIKHYIDNSKYFATAVSNIKLNFGCQ